MDNHYDDVIMSTIASQITSLTIVYSTIYSGADQSKHQSSASLAFVWGIHRAGEFPAQMASNAENVPIWWRHHARIDSTWYGKKYHGKFEHQHLKWWTYSILVAPLAIHTYPATLAQPKLDIKHVVGVTKIPFVNFSVNEMFDFTK